MPSPGSRNSPYSNPPDSPFHPPSPGVTLYQQQSQAMPQQPAQAPQQRLQRAVSIPSKCSKVNLKKIIKEKHFYFTVKILFLIYAHKTESKIFTQAGEMYMIKINNTNFCMIPYNIKCTRPFKRTLSFFAMHNKHASIMKTRGKVMVISYKKLRCTEKCKIKIKACAKSSAYFGYYSKNIVN